MPDFKTLADFRKGNGAAIGRVCSPYVLLRRQMQLLADAVAAIDGSKFKAVNSRDRNLSEAEFKARMQQLATWGEAMRQTPDHQLSMTGPDACSMATRSRGLGIVDYNVQMAVEASIPLIATHEVKNERHDRHRLASTVDAEKSNGMRRAHRDRRPRLLQR